MPNILCVLRVPVSFHPSIGACIGDTAHNLAADAATLAAAVNAAWSSLQSNPNAAAVEGLIGSYAAGEIGAAAFIAGIIELLGPVAVGLLLVGTGLTIYSLVQITECVLSGDGSSSSVGIVAPANRNGRVAV